ncbi:MAG: DUF6585 family protein [Fimbriiglobus sp.]
MSELGTYQCTFKRPAESLVVPFFALVFPVMGGHSVLEGLGLVAAFSKYPWYSNLFGGLLLIGCGVMMGWWWIHSLGGRVRLYEHGLKVNGVTVLFDEITAVVGAVAVRERGVPRLVGLPGRLILEGRRTVTISADLTDGYILFSRIHEAVHARLRPAIEAAVDRGERVPFGPIALSRDGLYKGDRVLPWDALGGFSFDLVETPNRLRFHDIFTAKPWAKVNLEKVPNGQLLLDLCREYARAEGFDPPAVGPDDVELPPLPRVVSSRPTRPAKRTSSGPVVVPSSHASSWAGSLGSGFMGIPALIVVIGGFLALLFTGVAIFREEVPGKEVRDIEVALGAWGVVGLGCLIPFARVGSVSIDADGIAWERCGWRTERAWGDVKSYQYSDVTMTDMTGGMSNRLVGLLLRFRGGRKLKLDLSFDGFDGLAQSTIRAVTVAMLQTARYEMAAGGVTFAAGFGDMAVGSTAPPVVLSSDGVRVGGRVRGWDEVERLWLGGGIIGWQFRDGTTHEAALEATPNYGVLVELVREQIGDRCEVPPII